MGDPVIIFHQIQLWNNSRMCCESSLPNGKEIFNGVLDFLVNLSLMKNSPESLKNGIYSGWCDISENLATLNHEVCCDFY